MNTGDWRQLTDIVPGLLGLIAASQPTSLPMPHREPPLAPVFGGVDGRSGQRSSLLQPPSGALHLSSSHFTR